MTFVLKTFKELTVDELYQIMQLRQQVFVVEQNCAYLDADGKDDKSWHLLGMEDGVLVAYCRILPAGVGYAEMSIGRVLTTYAVRKRGIGKELMRHAIVEAERLFGKKPIRIGAQAYLKKFYEQFGFIDVEEPYLEDGIPHLIMLRAS